MNWDVIAKYVEMAPWVILTLVVMAVISIVTYTTFYVLTFKKQPDWKRVVELALTRKERLPEEFAMELAILSTLGVGVMFTLIGIVISEDGFKGLYGLFVLLGTVACFFAWFFVRNIRAARKMHFNRLIKK